jgi:hypothetical protein
MHLPHEFTLDFYNILHYTFAVNSIIAIRKQISIELEIVLEYGATRIVNQ